ncbi:hypothetical protein D3C72_2079020 [compost metagenome]
MVPVLAPGKAGVAGAVSGLGLVGPVLPARAWVPRKAEKSRATKAGRVMVKLLFHEDS